jgi:hypothetical protein
MGKATFARSDDMTVLTTSGLVTVTDSAGVEVKVLHRARYEFGGGIVLSLTGNLFKNKVNYNSQLELFSNYVQNPQNVDVTWWATIKFLIYKNISADMRFDLVFDDDKKATDKDGTVRGAKVQVKNYWGVSLFYQF